MSEPTSLSDILPKVLPFYIKKVEERDDGASYIANNGMGVIVSAAYEDDDKLWLHVSISYPDKLPTWKDLKVVKEIFIGDDKYAYQILPPTDESVNTHPFCLHMFHCLEDDPLPDFTQGTGEI